jgi:hypothetical protein
VAVSFETVNTDRKMSPNKITGATAAPLRSSRVAGFDDVLRLLRVTGVITAGRLSLSSVVGRSARSRNLWKEKAGGRGK